MSETFISAAVDYYLSLSNIIAGWHCQKQAPIVVGVNGAQGAGKPAESSFLEIILRHEQCLTVAVMSIFDLYPAKPEKIRLATDAHPLLATRGCLGLKAIGKASRYR